METTSSGNVGRSNLPCESASQRAARETDPTSVVTRSSDISHVEPTPSMVTRSRTRGGRSSAAIPDVEIRPEIETRPEPEIDNPAEMKVSMSAICEGDLGATGPRIPETASQTAAFPASQEIVAKSNPNLTQNPNPPPHIRHLRRSLYCSWMKTCDKLLDLHWLPCSEYQRKQRHYW